MTEERGIAYRIVQWIAGVTASAAVLASTVPAAEIAWRDGAVRVVPMNAPQRFETLEALAVRTDRQRIVVTFSRPLRDGDKQVLARSGLTLLSPLGRGAWFATLGKGADLTAIAGFEPLESVSAIATERKLHADLVAGSVPSWSRLTPRPGSGLDAGRNYVAVYVLAHRDAPAGALVEALQRHGGGVSSTFASVHGVVGWLPADAVATLAAEDDVMYVEPPLPALTPHNAENRALIGADVLQAAPYDLDGSGVAVMVYDGGTAFAHTDFGTRLTIGPSDTSDLDNFHATHVAGTIGGDGSESGGTNAGMAPGVDLISYGFQQGTGNTLFQGFLYTDPGDIEQDYAEALSLGADLANNSIGTNVRLNGYPCHWEGDYATIGAVIDAITRGSLGQPFTNVWSNGNERGGGQQCGASYATTGPSACAKNSIAIGATNANDESVTSFTSFGPCDDGRLKPTLSAPGCQSNGDFGVTSTATGGGYDTFCGTSMSAPTTSGAVALVLERFRQVFPATPDPLPATLRAILAHTAEDLEDAGPDYKTGYGGLRAVAAVDLVADGRFFEDIVAQGETYRFSIDLPPGEPELKVTLAWDDPPGVPNVSVALVNDLDLRVVDPAGVVHHPWTLDPANPAVPAVRTQKDALNNLEQVVIDAPASGSYLVEIEGFDVPEGPAQGLSVATSHASLVCDSRAALLVGASRVACDAALDVRVADCDLDTDGGSPQAAGVTVTSASEPGGETFMLTETGNDTGLFAGAVPLGPVDLPGTIQVADGDAVTVSYTDADDGRGNVNVVRNVLLTADCAAPQATAVDVSAVGAGRATVDVTADSPVTVVVHYGTVCGAPAASTAGLNLAVQQSVPLGGLTPETNYVFHLEITDDLGRTTIDDNDGACYGFATLPDSIFLASWHPSGAPALFDHAQLTFTPDAPPAGYTFCRTLSNGYPTDPAGSTSFPGDDSYDLADGKTFPFYGQSYSTIYFSTAGYVTFGAPDDDVSGSPIDHYSLPRISAAFADLGAPPAGIQVLQTADRVAVTWDGVNSGFGINDDFQIELFFDGTIRITWIEVSSLDRLVGLSDGGGLDPAFVSADWNAGVCPSGPPQALDIHVDLIENVPQAVTFIGADDGTPQPLRFRIDRLPDVGTLIDDSTGDTIVSTPYLLPPGVDGVTYAPLSDWFGTDTFDYVAYDSGVPPTGGASNTATVTAEVFWNPNQTLGEFLVDDQDPGWNTAGGWAFGAPAGLAGDPAAAFTGTNVFGYNLNGEYGPLTVPESLHSGPIPLGQAVDVKVRFRRWLTTNDNGDTALFAYRTPSVPWTTAFDSTGGVYNDNSWTAVTYNVPDTATLYLRWDMGPTTLLGHAGGWNLDDIQILGRIDGDCDGGDPAVERVPAEVFDLHVDKTAQTAVSWADQALRSGSATAYELISGDVLPGLSDPAVACLQNSTATSHADTRTPAAGQVYFYLVQAWNTCGSGGFGDAARDAAFPDSDMDGPSDICDP